MDVNFSCNIGENSSDWLERMIGLGAPDIISGIQTILLKEGMQGSPEG